MSKADVLKKEKCAVCGDLASGYHYDVLSCEGCKGFFRRSIHKNLSVKCISNGGCEVTILTRKRCPGCRLKKCLDVGMKKTCLLTEHQCNARGTRRIKHSQTKNVNQLNNNFDAPEKRKVSWTEANYGRLPEADGTTEECISSDSEDHNKSIPYYSHISSVTDELLEYYGLRRVNQRHSQSSENPRSTIVNHRDRHSLISRFIQTSLHTTHLIIQIAKHTNPFSEFSVHDQIIMLKGSLMGLTLLKLAHNFDGTTNTVTTPDGQLHTTQTLQDIGGEELAACVFNLSHSLSDLQMDSTEFALISSIYLFSDRVGIDQQRNLNEAQELYCEALLAYCDKESTSDIGIKRFTKFVMKMIYINELSRIYSSVVFPFTIRILPLSH